jgi:hypothetical protein
MKIIWNILLYTIILPIVVIWVLFEWIFVSPFYNYDDDNKLFIKDKKTPELPTIIDKEEEPTPDNKVEINHTTIINNITNNYYSKSPDWRKQLEKDEEKKIN